MADEFMLFLVGGLAVIAILMILGIGIGFTPTGNVGIATYTNIGAPVFVGESEFDNVETLYASFDANNFLDSSVYSLGSRQVSNGLMFGSTSIKTDVYSEYTVVSFDVVSTNNYGDILIITDGRVAEQGRLDIGNHEFLIGPATTVEIAAKSSEWRIWAPAIYNLENVKIVANSYPRDISTYTFQLDNPEKVDSARIDFSLNSNAGALIMKLNGDIVYDGALNNRQTIYIDQSRLDDYNILTFDARTDSKFAGVATIALTKKTLEDRELRANVNLTNDEYNKFSTGSIAFDVTDVFSPGGYSVKIVNKNQVLLNEFVKLEKGYFVLKINKDNLKPGLNTVIVKALDGSAFYAQGLTVRL